MTSHPMFPDFICNLFLTALSFGHRLTFTSTSYEREEKEQDIKALSLMLEVIHHAERGNDLNLHAAAFLLHGGLTHSGMPVGIRQDLLTGFNDAENEADLKAVCYSPETILTSRRDASPNIHALQDVKGLSLFRDRWST